jgi:uncharacterized protein YdaU (DUF1376 family)
MWWIDRWRKSTAFTDMTLEQQAAYRNLLDEATLRGGAIPNDDRILARACGDPTRWKRIKPIVLKRFKLGADGWHNETLDQVLVSYTKREQYRAHKREQMRHNRGNKQGNKGGDPDPDPEVLTPLPPFEKGGRVTRKQLQMAEARRARVHGGCPHDPHCATYAACVRQLALDAKVRA